MVKEEAVSNGKTESSDVSGDQRFSKNIINKDLRIILKRCDGKGNFIPRLTRNELIMLHGAEDHCKKSFVNKTTFNRHAREVHNTVLIIGPSENCQKNSKSLPINERIQSVHKGLKWICTSENCKKIFFTSQGLIKHKKFKHENFRYTCKNCGKKLINLKRHVLNCLDNDKKNFHCSVQDCESSFFSKSGLKSHQKYVHERIRFTCGNCGKEVVNMRQHLQLCTKTDERQFHCTLKNCSSSFQTNLGLKTHLRLVHMDSVKCPHKDCSTYVKPYVMLQHLKHVHDRSESHTCNNCGKWYLYLKQHLAYCASDGVKKFLCHVDNCKASFVIKKYLNHHIRGVHTTPIKCPIKNCDKFMKPKNLVRHLKYIHERLVKSGEKCGKLFKRLEVHQKSCNN